MMIFYILSAILLFTGISLLLGLTPERITEDISRLIAPTPSIRDKAKIVQGKKKSRKLSQAFTNIRDALKDTGKDKQFALVCTAALFLSIGGGLFAVMIGNLFLLPVLVVALAGVPFLYIKSSLAHYEKHIQMELETALSIISTAFVRSDDIVSAVRENLSYIKPPVRGIFHHFLTQTTVISADTNAALRDLSQRIDNEIFREWCGCLCQCQVDRTLKVSLLPIVNKLTDVRIVNNELHTMLAEPQKEYWTMTALVIGNIPLLYAINKDWFDTMINTLFGKIALAISGVIILVTAVMMKRYTKPVEYKR